MLRYVIYKTATGRIRTVVTGLRTFAEANVNNGEAIAETELSATASDWVVNGEVVARPIFPGFGKLNIAADDTDAAKVVMAEPFAATIDGLNYLIDVPDAEGDYVLEITSAMPATYKVVIKHWPFQDYSAEVVAA